MQLAVFISFFSVSSSFSLLVHLGLMTKTQPLKDQEKETNDQKCKEQISQPAYMQLAVFISFFFSVSNSFSLLVHLGLMTKIQPLKDQEKETNDQKCKEQIYSLRICSQRFFLCVCDFQLLFDRVRGQTRKQQGRGKGEREKPPAFISLRLLKRWRFFSLGISATTTAMAAKISPKSGIHAVPNFIALIQTLLVSVVSCFVPSLTFY